MPSGERVFELKLMCDDYEVWRLVMFIYIFAAGLLADGQNINHSNEGLYAFGYFLCGFAFIMTIGCLIMAVKLKKINDQNAKNMKNLNL